MVIRMQRIMSILIILFALTLQSCGGGNDGGTAPSSGATAILAISVSVGNNQTATVGTAVGTLPAVLVANATGSPVAGVAVTFAVASGGGSITGASATSNANGIATVGSWTLGLTAGANTMTATSAGLAGSPVFFTATGAALTTLHAAGLNDTGQTLCYDSAGVTISCTVAPAADDGRYGRDAAATAGVLTKIGAGVAGFDFTKIANNGGVLAAGATLGAAATDWACTRDNVTALTWEVKTTTATDLRFSGHSYTWYNTNGAENGGNTGSAGVVNTCNGTLPSNQCNTQAFVAAVSTAALCGYTDWRLPTPRELRSIVNYGAGNSMDATYFLSTARPNFWSASTHARTPAYAWVVSFGVDDGGGDGHAHVKTNDDLARLVRGGVQSAPSQGACTAGNPNANVVGSTPSADFTDNGNGTVTHAKTGLMWKRCAEGLSGAGCATGAANTMTWSNALAAAESASFAGFTDWRLPNLKELHSIVETCGYDPAINQSIFPATPAPAFGSVFWSATSSASDPAKAAIFVFGGGGSVPNNKASLMHARLVRGE